MLRFNERALVALAAAPGAPDKAGFLLRKGERSFQGMQRRWFVLKGNILFYFKDQDATREPQGCVILERVAVVPNRNLCEFTLEFDCPDSRAMELAVDKADERQGWITALQQASYERQLETLLQLDAQLSLLLGKSPLEGMSFHQRPVTSHSHAVRRHTEIMRASERSAVQSSLRRMTGARDGRHSRSASADLTKILGSSVFGGDASLLENNPFINAKLLTIQFRVDQLALPADVWEVHVVVHEEKAGDVVEEVFRTEDKSVEGTAVVFATTANFSLLSPSASLRFTLQSPAGADGARDLGVARSRCSAITMFGCLPLFSVEQKLEQLGVLKLKCAGEGEVPVPPAVARADVIEAQVPVLDLLGRHRLTITERLTESAHLMPVALKLIGHFLKCDRAMLRRLEDLGPLLGAAECARQQAFAYGMARIQTMTSHMAFLDSFEETFKRSSTKKHREVELLTTNLHVHSLTVVEEDVGCKTYSIVTCGAPTALALGYKHGGLARMQNERVRTLRGGDLLGPCDKALGSIVHTVKNVILELDELKRALARPDFAQIASQTPARLEAKMEPLLRTLTHSIVTIAVERMAASRPLSGTEGKEGSGVFSASKMAASVVNTCEELVTALGNVSADPASVAAVDAACALLRKTLLLAGSEVQDCLMVTRLQVLGSVPEAEDILYRQDAVFSQALAALVTAFIRTLKDYGTEPQYLAQLVEVGFLAHFESLLSSHGDENHMLEDFDGAMALLQRVKFELLPSADPSAVNFNVDFATSEAAWIMRYDLRIQVYLPYDMFARLGIQRLALVKVCPILLTHGVNEMQSIANSLGGTAVQDSINERYMEKLKDYLRRLLDFQRPRGDNSERETAIAQLQASLEKILTVKGTKNVDFFSVSETLVREAQGGRITCCKSGKDRTGMAATLEETNLLMQFHGLDPAQQQTTLDWLRTHGVRRTNVFRNIDEDRFAFNKLQVYALPPLLRPPEGTYGSSKA